MKFTKGMEIYTNMISGICFKNVRKLVCPSLSPHKQLQRVIGARLDHYRGFLKHTIWYPVLFNIYISHKIENVNFHTKFKLIKQINYKNCFVKASAPKYTKLLIRNDS